MPRFSLSDPIQNYIENEKFDLSEAANKRKKEFDALKLRQIKEFEENEERLKLEWWKSAKIIRNENCVNCCHLITSCDDGGYDGLSVTLGCGLQFWELEEWTEELFIKAMSKGNRCLHFSREPKGI